MSTNLLNELAAEIANLESRLAGLKQAHSILSSGHNGNVAVVAPVGRQNALKPRKRAPGGFLEEHMMKVLGKDTLSNEQIRARLISENYPYSLEPTHCSKALSKLVLEKKLKGTGPKSQRRYHAL